jgi:hypothetical protein
MKPNAKRALVLLCASLLGYTLWLAGLTAAAIASFDLNIIPQTLVAGAGFILAGVSGIASAVYLMHRFWPRTISK